ncbi:MAG: CBS domain-containing protein [Candidatus Binatia bacterium]
MDVRRHMTPNPVTAGPQDSLRKVRLLMRQGRLRRLPVTDNGRVIGIVTDRDLWERSPSGVADPGRAPAEDLMDHLRVMGVMTLQPVTIAPTASILEAVRLLRATKVGALLVVDDQELVGIITKGDLLDALLTAAQSHSAASAPRS